MPKNKEIEFILSLRDQLSAKWNSITTQMKNSARELAATVQRHWLAISAGALAMFGVLRAGFQWAEDWAKGEVMMGAFRKTLQGMGRDADVEFARIKAAAAGMIDEDTLTQMANKWLSMRMPVERFTDVLKLARVKAREYGLGMKESFEALAEALASGKERALKELGISIERTQAEKDLANSLGITAKELTEVEKRHAMLNAVLVSGAKAVNGANLEITTLNEKVQKVRATIEEAKDFAGQAFTRLGMFVYGVVLGIWAGLTDVVAKGMAGLAALEGVARKMGLTSSFALTLAASDVAAYADEMRRNMQDAFDAMLASSEELAGANLSGPLPTPDEAAVRAKAVVQEVTKIAGTIKRLPMPRKLLGVDEHDLVKLSDSIQNIGWEWEALFNGAREGARTFSDELLVGISDALGEATSLFQKFFKSILMGMAEIVTQRIATKATSGLFGLIPGLDVIGEFLGISSDRTGLARSGSGGGAIVVSGTVDISNGKVFLRQQMPGYEAWNRKKIE